MGLTSYFFDHLVHSQSWGHSNQLVPKVVLVNVPQAVPEKPHV